MLDERAEGDPLEGARIMLAGTGGRPADSDVGFCADAISTPILPRKPL